MCVLVGRYIEVGYPFALGSYSTSSTPSGAPLASEKDPVAILSEVRKRRLATDRMQHIHDSCHQRSRIMDHHPLATASMHDGVISQTPDATAAKTNFSQGSPAGSGQVGLSGGLLRKI
jgi:hypothetical protein